MSHLPKTCADCRFYQGERFLMSDPKEAVHGCEILLYLGHAIPAHHVKKDEVPLDCPLANQLRFKTLCQECMVEDYNADLIEDRYSVKLPMFYNQNVAMTLDYLGGRLGYNKYVEEGLQRKGLFGRKPDTGYFNTTDKNGNVTNVGHQHDPIKDQEIRMEWASKRKPKPTLEERVDAIERKLSLQQKY